MKVALYCRVDRGGSEVSQKEAIFMQKQRLEHYAKRNHLQIVGYYGDYGFPGYMLKRPGLMKLLDAFAAGEFDAVLVVNRKRLYRRDQSKEPKWPFQIYSLSQRQHQLER